MADKLSDQIENALQRLTDVFVRQCTHGAQTKSLPAEFASCGQFIGPDAEGIRQSGLHGIAAALRVLAPCQSVECGLLVHRLVSYCEACFGISGTTEKCPDLDQRGDTDNVIKLGELLYSLSFVTTAQADCGKLVKHVSTRLTSSLLKDRGWGYFVGDSEPQLLPTAYAARGLAQHGFDLPGPGIYLLDSLIAKAQASAADLATLIACHYSLTFSRIRHTQHSQLRSAFLSAWRSLEPLFAESIEQNVEYWRNEDSYYVRIPWQLYLLALAADYSKWRLGWFRAERRLRSVIAAVGSNSLKYPYSGTHISSRTNSIAYDALSYIRDRVKGFRFFRPAYFIDRVRVFAGLFWFRVVAAIFALFVSVYAVAKWWQAGTIGDLAPELLAGLLMILLTLGRR